VTADLTGLTVATVYHGRLVATNSAGTSYGNDVAFLMLGGAPVVVTLAADGIDGNDATLNGTINPNLVATTGYFQWGTTTGYGNNTVSQNLGSGSTTTAVEAALSGLVAGTTYHFRLRATNATGTTYGNDMTFVTVAPTPINTVAQWRLHRFDLKPRREERA
jgi:hypothetical protein